MRRFWGAIGLVAFAGLAVACVPATSAPPVSTTQPLSGFRIEPGPMTFGPLGSGQQETGDFTLQGFGASSFPLTISTSGAGFTVSDTCPSTYKPPSLQCTITVTATGLATPGTTSGALAVNGSTFKLTLLSV